MVAVTEQEWNGSKTTDGPILYGDGNHILMKDEEEVPYCGG